MKNVKFALTVLCLLVSQFVLAQIIYVTPDGAGTGTKASPASIEDALNVYATTYSHIRLDTGVYNIDYELTVNKTGLILEGGFIEEDNWTKTSEVGATTIHRSGHNPTGPNSNQLGIIGINLADITDYFRFSDFKLIVDTPIPDFNAYTIDNGISTYGIKLNNCYYFKINRVVIDVAKGMDGFSGISYSNGSNGSFGFSGYENGGQGGSTSSFAGGIGGLSGSAFSNGGDGGNGIADVLNPRLGGSGGGGGGKRSSLVFSAGDGGDGGAPVGFPSLGGQGSNDDNLTNGENGVHGADGADAIGNIAPVFGTSYQPGKGINGEDGIGGGGGGGGGGRETGLFNSSSAGAGGSSGGDGGHGGHGGTGGGGTFGIYINNISGNEELINCLVNTATIGSTGGTGNLGTLGGFGASYTSPFLGVDDPGGYGGAGGNGGNGGDGTDGIDGDVITVYVGGANQLSLNESSSPIDTYPIVKLEEPRYQNINYILLEGNTHSSVNLSSPINDIVGATQTYTGFAIASLGSYACPGSSILYVDASSTGANNGSSWTDAFLTLEQALFAVDNCLSITDVYVAKGTYRPERMVKLDQRHYATFRINRDIRIYGGFAGNEVGPDDRSFVDGQIDPDNLTILNGDLAEDDVYLPNGIVSTINSTDWINSDNAIHVVLIDGVSDQMILDGFAITGGYANGVNIYDNFDRAGAGILIDGRINQTDPQIKNCIFKTNIATNWGGGIFNWGNTAPLIENCQFLNNTTYNSGGGVYNFADSGSCEPSFLKCNFAGNKAGNGAAASNFGSVNGIQTTAKYIQCLFTGNEGTNSSAFTTNTLESGGLATSEIINCTFSNNYPVAIETQGSGATSKIYNSILWGNDSNSLEGTGTYDIQNSIIEGAASNGTVYSDDPKFTDPYVGPVPNELGVYQLDNCLSPAIDLGDNSNFIASSTDTTDILGKKRFQSGPIGSVAYDSDINKIDLGPYEIQEAIDFTAKQDSSDAWIDLKWVVNDNECNCLTEDPNLKRGVTVQLKEGLILIESFEIFEEDIVDGIYEFEYRDYVGPNITKDYILEFKRTGPGTLNCRQTQRGKTYPFIAPVASYVDFEISPDSIRMDWTNVSDLTDNFLIYRGGSLIATIDATNVRDVDYSFSDVFSFTEDSFINGEYDTYCIATSSNLYESIYGIPLPQQHCFSTRSYDINLEASDSVFPDKVELSWSDVSAYTEQVRILRDGETIGSTSGTATSYIDDAPIFGRYSNYGVELVNNSLPFVGSYDVGRALPNGSIQAIILTTQEKVPVQNASVTMSWVEDDTYSLSNSFYSDHTGKINFTGLYYGESNEFKLYVSKPGETFEQDTIIITLSLDEPVQDGIIFFMEEDYNDDAPQLTIVSDFQTTPQVTLDQVDISWDFMKQLPTDQVYFNIYRETNLIYQDVNIDPSLALESYAIIDSEAVPDSVYEYSLHAFTLSGDDIIDTLFSIPTHFPPVAPVSNHNVGVDPSLGEVTINWSHGSSNNNGFRVYRIKDNVSENIYEGPKSESSFTDVTGEPGSVVGYYMSSFRTVDGIDYESVNTDTTMVLYPNMTEISELSLYAEPSEDKVEVTFMVPLVYIPDFQYNGIHIYRTTNGIEEKIASVDKALLTAGNNFNYTDFTGIPNESYVYEVRPYKVLGNAEYEKASTTESIVFPAVSLPIGLYTNSDEGKIISNWFNFSNNVHGFVVYKGASPDSIGHNTQALDENQFIDYTNNPPNSTNETYWVATERYINQDRYLSALVSVVADPPLINGDLAVYLKNFTATKDQANHVKLCWEWCDPATQTPFILRRNGSPIATLNYETRTYYDYDAEVNIDIEYSIETPGINNELNYQKVYTQGFIPGGKTLVGRVYKQQTNVGLDSVKIQVSGLNFLDFTYYTNNTYTNAAGFYKIEGLPNYYLDLAISAEEVNSSFVNNVEYLFVTPYDETSTYTVDFIDTNETLAGDGPIAEIITFKATQSQSELAIHLSWSPENENFDGFEIGKGLEVLGEVLKGEPLVWKDDTGIPGLLTMYSIRAFRNTGSGKEYSDYAQDAVVFPYLAPIEYLTATPLVEENKLLIQWSHPFDNHDLYTITRNGVPFDVVNTGEELFVIDSTGIPGVLYNYEVIAWQDAFQSLPKYISANYSDTEPIRDFDLTSPTVNYRLSTQSENVITSRNHLKLEWSYLENAADSFMLIRYIANANIKLDEQVLKRVDGQVRSYEDFSGLPNQLYHYEVVPLIYREGVEYYAKRRDGWAQSLLFPELHPPTELDITPIVNKGILEASFYIDYKGNDGYRMYRDGILIEELIETTYSAFQQAEPIFDNFGTPGTPYEYTLKCFSFRKDLNGQSIEFESEPAIFNINYPLPPTPVDFAATDGAYPNKIDLTWTYDTDIPVDEFEIHRKLPNDVFQLLATMAPGDRTYTDYITGNGLPPDEYLEIEYKIIAKNKGVDSSEALDVGSLYSGILADGSNSVYRGLGFDIDLDGKWAVAGTNGYGIQIYELGDDDTWALDTIITTPFDNIYGNYAGFGLEVAISGKYIVTSAKNHNQGRGVVYIFKRSSNDEWSLMQKIENFTDKYAMGQSVDIFDDSSLSGKDFVVFGSEGTSKGEITVMQRVGDEWLEFGELIGSFDGEKIGKLVTINKDKLFFSKDYDIITYYRMVGSIGNNPMLDFQVNRYAQTEVRSMDLDENKLIVGDQFSGIYSPAIIYEVDPSDFNQEYVVNTNGSDYQGFSVGIKGDFAISGSSYGNEVVLYNYVNDNWEYQYIPLDPSCIGTSFGFATQLSDNFAMIGMPLIGNQDGKVFFVPLTAGLPPEDVTATDGTQPGQVLVSWKEPNDLSQVSSYSVFRDGEFLATVSSVGTSGNTLNWIDLPSAGLVPGKHYVYQVQSTYGEMKSKSIGDEGWMPANGSISGTLTTLQGGAPVENATVTAKLYIEGDYLTYTATTNNLGAYQIDDIYYGEESTIEVSCEYLDHDIISQVSAGASTPSNILEVDLEVNAPSNTFASFFDATAYAIVGNVRHMDLENCYLDSVKVTRIYSVLQNGNRVRNKEEKITSEDGEFSFIINPELSGLDSLLIEIDNLRYIEDENGQVLDSISFEFEGISDDPLVMDDHPDGLLYLTDFNVQRVTEIAFHDQTLYPVTINVVNTCGTPLLSGIDEWTIRARSLDGCYERTLSTSNGMVALLDAPPLEMVFTVTDVSNKSLQNLVYLDYLINNPVNVQIDSLHINDSQNLSQAEIIEALTFSLEYHKPPIVQPDMSAMDFLCDDVTRQAIVNSGDQYTIPVDVVELFLPVACSATSGYLKVINGASAETAPVILEYDEDANKFEDYVFTAGAPNPVTPHRWNFKIEYYSDADLFQGEFSHEIFVIGSINLPGNGVLVDASDDTDEVPLPLFVLRDPPGDGSSSTISKGFSSTTTFGFTDEIGGGAGIYGEGTIALFGIGIEGSTEVTSGRFNEDSKELSITTFTSQDISTSDSPDAIGRDASIVVGAGVAMQYGLVSTYDIECDGNEGKITETRSLGFTPIEIKTTWTYTIGFIEDLIAGYERDLIDVASGETVLEKSNGDPYTTQEATDKLTALRDNWLQILDYFDEESNPIYHLTQSDFEDYSVHYNLTYFDNNTFSWNNLNAEANLWREALLADIGTDPNVIFDQNKLDKYNNAGTAIRELMNIANFVDVDGIIEGFYLEDAYADWAFSQARYDDVDYYESVAGISPNEMAENRTFSGLTNQEFSYGQTKSTSSGSNTNIFFNSDFMLGARFDADVEVQVAPFGIGIATKSIETENRIGAVGNFAYSTNSTVGDENVTEEQISYTLTDDDDLDEISVTVVKGIRPNHTPLFQTIGGQTSCPYEEGTLEKDKPIIQVLDPITGAPGNYGSLFFQDPDQPAEFTIQIANLSATLDDRDIAVFLDNNSNPNGATVKLGGVAIGSVEYSGLAHNSPLLLTLTVERGLAYDYTGLRIGVSPPCTGVDGGSSSNVDFFITLDVKFQSPCSPISIVKPDNNWLINGVNRDLVIGLRDYVPGTANFESVTLEYRKLDDGVLGFQSGWEPIPYSSIKETGDNNNPVFPSELADYNMANYGPGAIPTYFMVWEPDMGNSSLFTDGEYELRAVSTCKEGTITNFTYSNYVTGTIDRSSLQVFGTPEPADGVWIPGDEVSIEFNKNIDCNLLDDPDFVLDSLKVFVEGIEVTNATFTCFNNKIQMTVPDFSIYDGKIMTVSVENIQDDNGNFALETDEFGNTTLNIEWDFIITTSKAYWEQDSIVVQVYEGETLTYTAGLRSTDSQTSLTGLSIDRTTASSLWMDILPAGNFDINPNAVKPIELTFTGLTEGITYDTLTVANLPGSGVQPSLPIKVITVKQPPYPPDWTVDGNEYPNSMTIVANWRFKDSIDVSIDTLDQITVWLGSTLRGMGRIQNVGDDYIAYLTVYGSTSDTGDTLQFRVWDQSTDTEYDAFTDPAIEYGDNGFAGSTADPRILEVDMVKDKVRYIHLNQGYTWISFNSILEDMSIENVLSELTNLTPGDRILGQDGFAEYIDASAGWFAAPESKLDTFSTEKAYMVFLQSGPDSIRMTGCDAVPFTEFLLEGTNWVGFPSQVSLPLEIAVEVNDLSDVNQIKNKDISRITDGTDWTSGLLEDMVPNEGYKLFLSNLKAVTIPGSAPAPLNSPSVLRSSMIADPNDASTWTINLDEYAFTDVIPVVGRLTFGETIIQADGMKKVAAFINGELRGVADLLNLTELNKHLFTLFIGKDDVDSGEDVVLYYYDGTTVSHDLTLSIESLTNNGHGVYNYIDHLYWILDEDLCQDHLVLTLDDSPLNGLYEASQTITINGDVQVLNGADVIFSAPEILINELNIELGAEVETILTGCSN